MTIWWDIDCTKDISNKYVFSCRLNESNYELVVAISNQDYLDAPSAALNKCVLTPILKDDSDGASLIDDCALFFAAFVTIDTIDAINAIKLANIFAW